jgi:hypothetical protein
MFLHYTLFDKYDASGNKTVSDVVKDVQNTVILYPFIPGTYFESSFGHFTGYGAKYYVSGLCTGYVFRV